MNIRNIIPFNITARPSAFGLDISDSSIKIAYLEKKRQAFDLKSFSRIPIAEGIVKEGEIKKEKELIKAIRKCIDTTKGDPIKTIYTTCSLSEQHTFLKLVQLPKMKIKEVQEAIKWEAEANIPLSLEEVYLDWQIVSDKKDSDHLNVLINAAPRKLVDKYLDTLRAADIEPVLFEIESLATARSLIEKGWAPKPVLIIDIGAIRTSFIIFAEKCVRFTSSASISNQQMIGDIVGKLKISPEEAQSLKFKIGLDKRKKQGEVFSALLPSLVKLVNQIKDYITFYKDQIHKTGEAQEDISKIILCGGGAYLKGLSQYLSGRLKIPVTLGTPWVNILKAPIKKIPGIPHKESLAYSTVLGLALKGVDMKFWE